MKAEERYKQMTRAERRVAIAKDVIKQVNAGVFDIRQSFGFIASRRNKHVALGGVINKENALETAKECAMCARGALMISRIANFNKVQVDAHFRIDRMDTSDALRDAFSENQLDEIECAFECRYIVGDYPNAVAFGLSFRNSSDRIIAIMQNIIDHDGHFKPSVPYEVKYVN